MASKLDILREGGFSEAEIADWVDKRRTMLREGGFPENEIEAYFTGGPVVSDKIPNAFIRRLELGQKFQESDERLVPFGVEQAISMAPKTDPGTERLKEAVAKGWQEGYGTGPSEAIQKQDKAMKEWGVYRNGDDGPVLGAIRFTNEAMLRPAASAVDAIMRGFNAATTSAGAVVGQIAKEGGSTEADSRKLAADAKIIADMAMIAPMFGPHGGKPPSFSRVERRGADVVDIPIGELPKSQDFPAVARELSRTPDAPPHVVEKAHRLWEERGIHPAELLDDARTDPVLRQDLLSTNKELPSRYKSSEDFVKQGELLGETPDQGSFRFMLEPEQTAPAPEFPRRNAQGKFVKRPVEATEFDTYLVPDPENPSGAPTTYELALGGQMPEKGQFRRADGTILGRYSKSTMEGVQESLPLDSGYQPSMKFDSGEGVKPPPTEYTKPEGQPGLTVSKEPPSPPSGTPPASSDKPSPVERAKNFVHSLYTDFVDNLHPLSRLDKDAYRAARLFRGRFGVSKQFLENGTVDFGTMKRVGPGFHQVIKGVKDTEGLNTYLRDRAEVYAAGPDAVEALKRVKAGDKQFGKVAKELDVYQDQVLQYLADSGVLDAETLAGMRVLDRTYTALAPDGVTSPDPLANIIRSTYHYVGLAQKNLAMQQIFLALEKAGIGVESKASLNVEMGKNMRAFLKANDFKAPPAVVSNILKSILPDDGKNVSALFDGKRRSLRIDDKELLDAIRALSPQNQGAVVRFLSHPATWLRAGVTLDPAFMAKNIIRDTFSVFVNTGAHPLDTAKGFGHALSGTKAGKALGLKPTETFQDWLSSGGANATLVHLDQRYLQQSLRHLDNQTGFTNMAWNIVRTPFDQLRALSELVENSVRLGAYQRAMKGKSGPEAMSDAAMTSREATVDFARIGAKTQAFNLITAFANVAIQGPDRLARAFIDNPKSTAAKVALGITLPSMYVWWASKDDPRYQNEPQVVKDMFWVIPTDKWEPISAYDAAGKPDYLLRQGPKGLEFNNGTIWRIPKPFELGIMFGSTAERALEKYYRGNPDAFKDVDEMLGKAFNMSYIPTFALPFVEQWTNTSALTDRKIIPGYLEKTLPEYQYTPYTTEVAKFLGSAAASLPGLREASLDETGLVGAAARTVSSPVLIENYVRAWTGGLGRLLLEATDKTLQKTGALESIPGPTETLADNPFLRAFVIRHPSANTQAIKDFYEASDRTARYYKAWRDKAREGDELAMARIEAAGGEEIFVKLDSLREALAQHGQLIRGIYKNKEIPPAEQRQLIDEYYFNMAALGEAGRDILRSIKQSEPSPPISGVQPTQPSQPAPFQSGPTLR